MTESVKDLAHLRDLVMRVKVGMLTSVDGEVGLRSRPLHTRDFDSEGNLWFFVDARSAKIGEVQAEGGLVNLSYADPSKFNFVSISGHASVIRDEERMRSLWTKMIEVWFPLGLADPNLALLKVSVSSAEYWESPGSAVMRIFGVAKALATGDPAALGKDQKVSLV